jgi:hypothetical protein
MAYSQQVQAPLDFDSSRISPEIRTALSAQAPEISRHVREVADLPRTPDRGISQQPRSNR